MKNDNFTTEKKMLEGVEYYLYITIISVVLVFSIVSNVMVILCVARFRKLRSVTNVLIGNLALTDILLAGMYIPQKIHDISHTDSYTEGEFTCKLINFTPILLITSSCYTLVCVSVERRRAIVLSHKPQMTLKQLGKVIPCIWLFSLIISIPTIFEYTVSNFGSHKEDNETILHYRCGNSDRTKHFILTNGCLVILISFLVPLVLIFVNYISLAKFINRKGRQISNGQGNCQNGVFAVQGQTNPRPSTHLHRNRLKLVKMLILVVVMFAVSWVPFFVLYLYMKITGKDASNDAGSFTGIMLITMATFSTAYNVVIYVVFNKNFRDAFRDILKCKWTRPMNETFSSRTN